MIVGLTGGIGSGKSTVAQMFSELGVPVYNADKEAKKLMASSKKIKSEIIRLLGERAFQNNRLDTEFIAGKVFTDKEALKKLNNIVHPAVREHFQNWAKRQRSPYVIQENAIIFENSSQDNYDRVVLVIAPLELRMDRVLKRDATTEEKVAERIKNQLKDDEKEKLADFVIENLEIEMTRSKVFEIHGQLLNIASSIT